MQVCFVEEGKVSRSVALGLMGGFLGGLTTFSAFCLDTLLLWEQGGVTPTVLGVINALVVPLFGILMTYSKNILFITPAGAKLSRLAVAQQQNPAASVELSSETTG